MARAPLKPSPRTPPTSSSTSPPGTTPRGPLASSPRPSIDRRGFLQTLAGGALAVATGCDGGAIDSGARTNLPTPDLADVPVSSTSNGTRPVAVSTTGPRKSVVITPPDLSLDWPAVAAAIGLDTLALHTHDPSIDLIPFIQSSDGARFLARCAELRLDVEYEVHAMGDLLPRSLFATRPELFRMGADCQRTPDNNLCVHQPDALAIAADNARALAAALRPTTGRYYLWPDDGANWCQCACCGPLGFSDQQLILENAILEGLRADDSGARLAHLAYLQTLAVPVEVTPAEGIFLEFAPINRRYDIPFDTPSDPVQEQHLVALADNIKVFGATGAKALEYWLDVSRQSYWTLPARELSFDEARVAGDMATYRALGVQDFATFAVWLDADYVSRFGDEAVAQYGQALRMK